MEKLSRRQLEPTCSAGGPESRMDKGGRVSRLWLTSFCGVWDSKVLWCEVGVAGCA